MASHEQTPGGPARRSRRVFQFGMLDMLGAFVVLAMTLGLLRWSPLEFLPITLFVLGSSIGACLADERPWTAVVTGAFCGAIGCSVGVILVGNVHPSIYALLQELVVAFAAFFGAIGGALVGLMLGPFLTWLSSSAPKVDEQTSQGSWGHLVRLLKSKPAVVVILLFAVVAAERCFVPSSGPTFWPAATLKGHQAPLFSVAFSPDGRTLASASGDTTICLWDPATGDQVARLAGHTDIVYALAFSPDGKTLASGSADQSVRLWDLASGREVIKLAGHKNGVVDVAFSPNGRLIYSAAGSIGRWAGGVKLWDVTTGRELATFDWPGALISLAVSADGRLVAVGHGGSTCVKLLDGRTLKELAARQGHAQSICAVAISPDRQVLATAGAIGDRRAELIVWQLNPLTKYREISEQARFVCSLALAPDAVTLASGSDAETIRLWDIRKGKLRALLRGHRYSADSIAFSPDGDLLACGGPDGVVRVWDVSSLGLDGTARPR